MNSFLIVFVWPLICFFAGMMVHRWMTRNQRRLLRSYRQREKMLRKWNQPIE